jgi:acyl-coenzyme A synthetase/AMP-(fatty) acid ligase
MLRGIWGDPDRYVRQYWSKYKDIYFTGDGAKVDKDGCFWLIGRVDDVMNISGHRVSTMEVESALVDHPAVAEAAVIGKRHDVKGQAIAAFVTIKEGVAATDALREEVKEHVAKKIGALARPDDIIFSAELPKTRSGKIMRRPCPRRHHDARRSQRRRDAQEEVRGGVTGHPAPWPGTSSSSGAAFRPSSRPRTAARRSAASSASDSRR